MPTGTVRDEGDPGTMKGIRLGKIEPDDAPETSIPFDNHRRLKVGIRVSYVIDHVGGHKFALNVHRIK